MTAIEQQAIQAATEALEETLHDFNQNEKLIRDEIPNLPDFSGSTRIASEKEMPMLLAKKLQEECDEAIAELLLIDPGMPNQDLTEELADIFEVILAMAFHTGIDMTKVYDIANDKRTQRGGFQNGVILVQSSSDK